MAAHTEKHGKMSTKTLFVRNLPYSTTNESLEKVFSEVGPIKQCFVVGDTDTGKCRGFGYVKFTLLEDAEKSLTTIKKVAGRPVHLCFANRKEKKKRFGQPKRPPKGEGDILDEEDEFKEVKPDVPEIKVVVPPKAKTYTKKLKEEKVKIEPKAHSEGKRARLIIRNLSFKCNEAQLREVFSKFGTIDDVHIPTKDHGLKRGFGFVQFSNKAEAGMAVKALNGKAIVDRKVAVDFTLPKGKYEQQVADKAQAKAEEASVKEEDEEPSMSMDVDDDDEDDLKDIKLEDSEEEEDDEEEEDLKEDSEEQEDDDEEEEDESNDNEEMSEGSDSDEENDDDDDDDDNEDFEESFKPKTDRPSDVNQGKTVFIRNVPYDATDDQLEEYFSQFGDLRYARCVFDHNSGMSRGTAFVQFSARESADLCMKGPSQAGQHTLGGRELLVTLAVDRNTAQGLRKEKDKIPKDTRNLYLAREGMIRPGTEAAKDVPATDLARRLKNDTMKRRKLKDQNTFISSTRLCLHNIPATVDDKGLKEVVLKNIGNRKKSEVKSVKVMRDLGRVSSDGVARSRGYAFAEFTTHETALAVLQHMNNSPAVFGPHKRPIVEFSIENRKALQTKEKRMEKSKMKQIQEKEKAAMVKGKPKPNRPNQNQNQNQRPKSKPKPNRRPYQGGVVDRKKQDQIARSMHGGGPVGLPRHSGTKQRHKPRPNQTQVKARKPKGFVHPAKAHPPRKQREPKVKTQTSRRNKGGRKDVDSFDKLVASHKRKIMASGISF